MAELNEQVKGCVGIYIAKNGHVVASVSDFELQGYGGHSLYESQEHRVRERLAYAVLVAYCNTIVPDALEGWERWELLRKIITRSGGKVHFIAIGHPEKEGNKTP